jgi:hypothetical protein
MYKKGNDSEHILDHEHVPGSRLHWLWLGCLDDDDGRHGSRRGTSSLGILIFCWTEGSDDE